jgi:hypothetical protein
MDVLFMAVVAMTVAVVAVSVVRGGGGSHGGAHFAM